MRAIITAILLAAAAADTAAAATIGEAKIAFSADRQLSIEGKIYDGKMWGMPGAERHEQNINGIPAIFVLHRDTPLAEAVLPRMHTVVDFLLPPELKMFDDPRLKKRVIDQETVNGVPTTKYALTVDVPEGHGDGTMWMSDTGIPMKLDGQFTKTNGKSGRLHWELTNVRIGPQPASLFTTPPGFTKLPAEAVAPLLGLQLKSAKAH